MCLVKGNLDCVNLYSSKEDLIPAVRGTDDTTLELSYRFIVLTPDFFKFRSIFKYTLFFFSFSLYIFLSFHTAVKFNRSSTDISKFSGQSCANLSDGQRSPITMNIWFSSIKLLSFVKYSYIVARSCHLCSIRTPPPTPHPSPQPLPPFTVFELVTAHLSWSLLAAETLNSLSSLPFLLLLLLLLVAVVLCSFAWIEQLDRKEIVWKFCWIF